MTDAEKLEMRVSQLLDKTTIVITGEGVGRLHTGQSLLILAVGQRLQDLGVPLVVPKAEVIVDAVTNYYAIAKTPEYEATTETGLGAAIMGITQRKVLRRDPLKVDEKQLLGNPAWVPVGVGDPVIRSGDLSAFVDQVATETAK